MGNVVRLHKEGSHDADIDGAVLPGDSERFGDELSAVFERALIFMETMDDGVIGSSILKLYRSLEIFRDNLKNVNTSIAARRAS